jgi:hypothetical protein
MLTMELPDGRVYRIRAEQDEAGFYAIVEALNQKASGTRKRSGIICQGQRHFQSLWPALTDGQSLVYQLQAQGPPNC